MADRIELLESALDSLAEGIALADPARRIVFWNVAAAAITGHGASELLGRKVREAIKTVLAGDVRLWNRRTDAQFNSECGSLVRLRHRLGHDVPVMARVLALRDGLGGRIGMAAMFHPVESLDALPHGDCGKGVGVEVSQASLEDRLQSEFEDFLQAQLPFGVLWITVDQAHELRKTHGGNACKAMLEKVERALVNGLRPGEEVGRWGEDEFLVISHERTPEMLAVHAQTLAGMARTADFRWWGDRVSLTVSIGAAQVTPDEALAQLLERAQDAMESSIHGGGNQIASAPRRQSCLPS
jgi:diguanylate cyclase (GGDEF)-like protein/PAS domain S-box-containing protein